MIAHKNRVFRFTSSNISKLTSTGKGALGFGAPAITYIEEIRAQRCLGRGIDTGAVSQALTWGKVMEYYCHKFELGIEYELCSHDSIIHPKYIFWSGTPDVKTSKKTGEIKCFYPKAFYLLSKLLMELNEGISSLEKAKTDEKEIYYQVVSNAIINQHSTAEIIAYTPTEEQLFIIRKELEETNIAEQLGLNPWNVRFIVESPIEQLPYIPNGIKWPNFVKHTFEVPTDDIVFLTKCVLNAEKLLSNE